MSVHHRDYANQHAQAPIDRNRKTAAKIISSDLQSKSARWPESVPPIVDQDRLTILLLMTAMVLSALNFMLRFPDLGAVITQYNQF